MNLNFSQHRVTQLIWILAVISIAGLIIAVITSQGWPTNSGDKGSLAPVSSTPRLNDQSPAMSTNCTAMVIGPDYSPELFNPPMVVVYDSRQFFVNWTVVNTSQDCVWTSLQLLTGVEGQLKTLNLMPPDHSQPVIDEEFAIWDKNSLAVNQVDTGQRVTISVPINGLDLIKSNGKIDRFYDLIVNGEIAARLLARQESWVVVILPTATPTLTFTPTITASPTGTPTATASPSRTPNYDFLTTLTPTNVVLPPKKPVNTPTNVVPTLKPTTPTPKDTPTIAPPPVDTPTLSNP